MAAPGNDHMTFPQPFQKHFWVDDFPNFPFGGIMDSFPHIASSHANGISKLTWCVLRLVTTCRRIAAQLRHADILWVMMQAFPTYFHYISGRALQTNTNRAYKVGPLPVVNGAISPTSRVITITPVRPQLPIYFRPFSGVISPFITGSGAHFVVLLLHFGRWGSASWVVFHLPKLPKACRLLLALTRCVPVLVHWRTGKTCIWIE